MTTLIIDEWELSKLSVDKIEDSWLEKQVPTWPEGLLIPTAKAIYARTLMNNNEAKVSVLIFLSTFIFVNIYSLFL